MTLHKISEQLGEQIWLNMNQLCLGTDEEVAFINLLLNYGDIILNCCKNKHHYQKLIDNALKSSINTQLINWETTPPHIMTEKITGKEKEELQ